MALAAAAFGGQPQHGVYGGALAVISIIITLIFSIQEHGLT